ncbi:MAG: UbiD family decarboxylase [Chloroflexi bacterium]|nr:UbiD family decarboxylase [Chloroflexota bacterium]
MGNTGCDLRDWLERVDDLGQLRVLNGADWDHEIGTVTEIVYNKMNAPAVLFDSVPGYPAGYRVLVNALGSTQRLALTLGLPSGATAQEMKRFWKVRAGQGMIDPTFVEHGPVLENVHRGDEIDILEFPVPKWHDQDGGRYVGTGNITITQDPDTGWVNCGTYRVMVHDAQHLGFYISPGQHGRIHRSKYLEAGRPCPVAISFGHHPLFFLTGAFEVPFGVSEYAFNGGILGRPVEVIRGPITGLPIPAESEVAIEGVAMPGDTRLEGPFGEWTGYYASKARPEPVIEIKAIYHRNNPILLGYPPAKPSVAQAHYRAIIRSALIEKQLEAAGVPDVKGVWSHEAAGARMLNVVSIKQRYPGHARQAGAVAAQCSAGARMSRYVVVVDDDIDPTDLQEVIWAIATRTDPERSIDIMKRCWSGPLDPMIRPGEPGLASRAIIDATRPYEWINEFPPVVGASKEDKDAVLARWGEALGL